MTQFREDGDLRYMDSYAGRIRLARERLAQAEVEMDNLLDSNTNDHQRSGQLLQDMNSARNELLTLLSSWPESAEFGELPISDGGVGVNAVPEITIHHL